ncbi:MAG: CHRD domain-containing protein [Acidobacteriia bacterium]|nr:CHRD domain-containing protein [Terriglobia bacterium]
MTRTFLRPALAVLACAGTLALASPSMADMLKMKADLKASNEVPPAKSSGSGSVDVTYDTGKKMLSWKGTYSGLTGAATAAHFHAGESGKNGGVVVPIFQGAAAKSPFEGSKQLTDAQAAQLMAGGWYVNIHTAANKAGEIRGQVVK